MSDPSFGTWLRREREHRGTTLKAISDQTKVSQALLQGLEADDLSRWPAGIFRRAFVRSYATAIGLDPDDVIKRFELDHGETRLEAEGPQVAGDGSAPADGVITAGVERAEKKAPPAFAATGKRARMLGTAADLTVALVLGLASAAADSRLLWPVLLIAAYYALGVIFTGTSPMVALLNSPPAPTPGQSPVAPAPPRPAERRHTPRRGGSRSSRASRPVRQPVGPGL